MSKAFWFLFLLGVVNGYLFARGLVFFFRARDLLTVAKRTYEDAAAAKALYEDARRELERCPTAAK